MIKTSTNNIRILIADNDEADRARMAALLEMHGYEVIQAIDGGSAIRVLEDWPVDAALIAHKMSPHDGFEVARHILVKGYRIGMIMLANSSTTDVLLEAGKFHISQVVQKPVDPDKLINIVRRVLRAHGKNPDALAESAAQAFSPQELMQRAVALARQNAKSRMGGPFGAIVADKDGRILGEGVNGVTTRSDPIAHAEVMAIRRATEKTGSTRLEGCVVYCSSEPTMLGQALIISTGIEKVYYALSHEEVGATRINEDGILGEIAKPLAQRAVPYEQLLHDDAAAMFSAWQQQKEKIPD